MRRGPMPIFLSAALLGRDAWAAWPDIYPSRVAAIEALRYDLIMPGIRRDEPTVMERYATACRKGFNETCQPEWSGDLSAAAEHFRRQCSHEPLACTVMGWDLSRVDGDVSPFAADPTAAARLFRAACEEKLYAPACTSLGELYIVGVGVPADPAAAEALLAEGCQAKDYWGCHQLGRLLERNAFGDEHAEQAAAYFQKACSNTIVQGCAALGSLLEVGGGIERDLTAAAELYARGCEAGIMDSCLRLGELYAEGRGVSQSGALAMGLFRTACEAEDLRGCYGEGVLLASGEGVQQNIRAALTRFDRTCEAGYAPGCSRLGLIYLRGQDIQKDRRLGMRYLERGCNAGDPLGCEALGAALVEGDRTVPPDPERAIQVLHLSCEGGSGRACGLMAMLYDSGTLPPGDRSPQVLHQLACTRAHGESCRWLAERAPSEAGDWYQRGCQADDGRSCARLGEAALSAGERRTARRWLRQACQLSERSACVMAGQLFEEQEDLIEALALYERGCEQGVEAACRAAVPITFEARFNDILRSAFSSSVCQLWRIDPSSPSESELLVEADGPRFQVQAGVHRGSEAHAWHLSESIEEGVIWAGRSQWSIGGGDSTENAWLNPVSERPPAWPPQPAAVEASTAWQRQDRYWELMVDLYETWDSRESVETFPGVSSFAKDQDRVNSLTYSRDDGSISRVHPGQCTFLGGTTVLQTEHCSEVQALLAATLVTTCQ